MCAHPHKCLKLLLMLGVVQSTLGLNSSLDRNSVSALFEKKLDVLDRPLHIVVTGDKYIGKSSIVSHLVRNKRFQQNATASKVMIPSTSKKVSHQKFPNEVLKFTVIINWFQISLILQEASLTDLDRVSCDGILMAYSPYDANSLSELSRK